MKIVVVGIGSIGTRHLKNLVELGHHVYAVDIDMERLSAVSAFAKGTFFSLHDALKIKPDVAFICTFSNDHIIPSIECAQAGCHLFIEKPLSLNLDGIDDLIEMVNLRNLITMTGCNMRFHPAISYMHDTLNNNPGFGKRLWANLEFGFYLPFDKEDYESSYKANRSMGGNLIFDGIHELDYAVWFFGEPAEVICNKGIISSLKIDTEDHVEMIIKFKTGSVCTIHMDYLQHGYSRRCKIVCEGGTIVWDFAQGNIGIISSEKEWHWKEMKLGIYDNRMYTDEIKYFFDCIISQKETFNSVEKSLLVLKLALAADRSCLSNAWERIE
ncbi:MAG: Gfo/Idh/MocA family oxidoreductase [Candidatus Scalindua rubra]|uniref:Putative oxidoreductase n=1 Tax=Candidatus Scalindua brodae TaxID=237368 RepID=A0A0B0EBF1_9BACT|nr:MAG: putative oxidoreductase [Candidatus Scalindua brodae]MBZ0109638.1 Gfo/Idh/MocA family oxidoreductase [Candidatus Scalindua rubra]TWU33107.1 4-carboxy-2-hydroxymuconate-6-semialdehyde dehydrogenase [Candidatus Brocadiaceae bacterium S225]